MKKNLWIWNHYATDMYRNRGGRHYWFAKNLIKEGYNATIFCANTYHNKTEYIDTGTKKYTTDVIDNIPFVFVKTIIALGNDINRIKNIVIFYFNLLSVAKKYAKINGKPDIIIASSVHPLTMIAGIQVAKKLAIPCICEIRDLWPEAIFSFNKVKEKSLLGKFLVSGEHWIYKKADALIFTKEGDVDYIKENKWDNLQGGDIDLSKINYISNGIDLEEFNRLIEEKKLEDSDLDKNKFNVVYVGAIRPVNEVGNILDAAALLKDEVDIQFLIYGDGNQKSLLEKRVENENLNNVKMKGFVSKQLIPYILSRSYLNILNYSRTRYNWARGNSSNKLFEYMASGKPIISTVKMGYSMINKYKCGFELDDGSAKDLADMIIKMKNMPKERYNELGNNAKEGVKDFDFKFLTKKLISAVEKLY
jgi:glycosyltransferase involved in cell wall biosynthesis